jgi:hypothetical protein
MRKLLLRIVLPAIVLGAVYQYGYSVGRSAGIRASSGMPVITSAPVSIPVAPIAPLPVTLPKVIETSSEVLPVPVPSPTVKRVRQTPDGLVVENHSVQPLPSVKRSEKVVFRTPNVSGDSSVAVAAPLQQQSKLQPLKLTNTPGALPPLAKPQTAPQADCGCGK